MTIKKFFSKIFIIITLPLLVTEKLLIYFYKFCISPLLPNCCRFYPTCSTYFLQALKEYGAVKGFFIGCKRLIRCNPFNKGGFDPVKPNIKGNIKWVL